MEKEVESVVNGFVGLNAKQQAECLTALVDTRHGDRVERSMGDRAANELPHEDNYRRRASRDRIF